MRDAKKWGKKILYLQSKEHLKNVNFASDCLCTIKFEKCFLDFMVSNRCSETTVVFFHAALTERVDLQLPVFSGARLGAGLNVNKIFVSDPSLYLSNTLRLGWFLGNRYLHGEEQITSSLLQILRNLGTKKVILFGASAGGFASILYGGRIKNLSELEVISIAINPQTNILKFSKGPVRDYFQTCWDVNYNDFDVLKTLNLTYDLTCSPELISNLPLLYIQNTGDDHYRDHFLPFLNFCNNKLESNGKFFAADWFGVGHISPPLDYLKKILINALTLDLNSNHPPGFQNFKELAN